MPNLRIIYDNAADRASSLVASTTAGALVAANLQNDTKGLVHRSTGTSVTLTATWAGGETVGGVALPASNLTGGATARARLYDATVGGTLLADTGVVYACPGANLGDWDWSQPINANAFALGGLSKSALWFDAHYVAKRCVIDLVDVDNAAGYIDNARLVIGAYWEPINNANYGAKAIPMDATQSARTDAGDNPSDLSFMYDTLTLDLKTMPEADRASIMRIFRNAGTRRNIFVSLLPQYVSPVAEQDFMIYGKRANDGASLDFYRNYSTTLSVEGW